MQSMAWVGGRVVLASALRYALWDPPSGRVATLAAFAPDAPAPLPLAKALPRVAAAGSGLLDRDGDAAPRVLQAVGRLPQVAELCAAVYSCGPPL